MKYEHPQKTENKLYCICVYWKETIVSGIISYAVLCQAIFGTQFHSKSSMETRRKNPWFTHYHWWPQRGTPEGLTVHDICVHEKKMLESWLYEQLYPRGLEQSLRHWQECKDHVLDKGSAGPHSTRWLPLTGKWNKI